MAFKINTTSVINNSAQIPWGNITSVPFFLQYGTFGYLGYFTIGTSGVALVIYS